MNAIIENPICVNDIGVWFYWNKKGKDFYVVGSKSVDKYFIVDQQKKEVIKYAIGLMDGKNSAIDINEKIKEEFQVDLDINDLMTSLKKAGLLENHSNEKSSELDVFAKTVLNINFKPMVERRRKFLSWLWNILFLLSIGTIIAAIATIILKNNEFATFLKNSFKYKDSYLLGAILTSIASIINIALHECAHAITSVRFGLQPSNFGVKIYGGFKLLWLVKINGMYTVERYKRIAIMISGIYMNFLLICVSAVICLWAPISGITYDILSKVMLNNVFMILACSMPFNISDGYYVVSQMAKRANMRKKMFQILNFKKNSFRNVDIWDVMYALTSTAMLAYSFYLTGIWCYKIILELNSTISILTENTAVHYILIAIPVLLIVWFYYIFIRRFFKLIKAHA